MLERKGGGRKEGLSRGDDGNVDGSGKEPAAAEAARTRKIEKKSRSRHNRPKWVVECSQDWWLLDLHRHPKSHQQELSPLQEGLPHLSASTSH